MTEFTRRKDDGDYPVSLGEVARNLERWQAESVISNEQARQTFKEGMQSLSNKLDSVAATMVSIGVYQAQHSALTDRVRGLEDSQRWIVRAILSIVVIAVIGGAVGTGLAK